MPALARGIALLAVLTTPPGTAAESARVAYVIDGDTFRLTTGERIRIAGIDAPESRIGQARCPAEIERGKTAAMRARTLLDGRAVVIERVGRSYGRTVARVALGGRDLAAQLIAIGAARRWVRGAPKPGWCAGERRSTQTAKSR